MKQILSNQKNGNPKIIAIKNPMAKIYRLSIFVLMLSVLSLVLLSCADSKKDIAESATQQTFEASQMTNDAIISPQNNYEIVPNEKVCMVNDRFMGVPQIPIDVNGTTYYGCCEGCVEKLQKNIDDVRFGNNPLTETKLDKASAVIVQDKSIGSVFYFASKEDAQDFISKNKS